MVNALFMKAPNSANPTFAVSELRLMMNVTSQRGFLRDVAGCHSRRFVIVLAHLPESGLVIVRDDIPGYFRQMRPTKQTRPPLHCSGRPSLISTSGDTPEDALSSHKCIANPGS